MRCLFCGSEMRLDQVDKNESVSVSGYEWHTFRCSSCGDVERRLALSTGSNASNAEPAPPIQTVSTDKQAAAPQCGDVERRLASSTGSGPGHAEPAPAIQTVSTDKQAAALDDVVGPVFGRVAGVYTRLRRLVLRRQVPAPTLPPGLRKCVVAGRRQRPLPQRFDQGRGPRPAWRGQP
jgi:hypothetical protein